MCLCIRTPSPTPHPIFLGKVLIYSKPIKVKEEMFYVTFKLEGTWNAYRAMRVCAEFWTNLSTSHLHSWIEPPFKNFFCGGRKEFWPVSLARGFDSFGSLVLCWPVIRMKSNTAKVHVLYVPFTAWHCKNYRTLTAAEPRNWVIACRVLAIKLPLTFVKNMTSPFSSFLWAWNILIRDFCKFACSCNIREQRIMSALLYARKVTFP